MIGPGLLAAAGDVKDEVEQIPANLFDGRVTGRDAAGVEIDEVGPSLGESGTGGDLDHGDKREAVRRALAGGEQVHVHRSELLRSADEIARRCSGEDEAL